jgi:hypothetical protein
MATYPKQRRKNAGPKTECRKGRVDKARIRQANAQPHKNKYGHKRNEE